MRPPLELKAYFRDLIAACGGTKRAAQITSFNACNLSSAMAAHETERWPRIDHVMLLEADCGAPIVTAALADAAGFALVARRSAAPRLDTLHHLRGIRKETGDVQLQLAAAMHDGALSRNERRALRKEVGEAQAALEALRRDLAAQERGDDA